MGGILQYWIIKSFLVNVSVPTLWKSLCPVLMSLVSKNLPAVVFTFKNKQAFWVN